MLTLQAPTTKRLVQVEFSTSGAFSANTSLQICKPVASNIDASGQQACRNTRKDEYDPDLACVG